MFTEYKSTLSAGFTKLSEKKYEWTSFRASSCV